MADTFRVGEWFVEPQLNSITANGNTLRLEPKIMQVLMAGTLIILLSPLDALQASRDHKSIVMA